MLYCRTHPSCALSHCITRCNRLDEHESCHAFILFFYEMSVCLCCGLGMCGLFYFLSDVYLQYALLCDTDIIIDLYLVIYYLFIMSFCFFDMHIAHLLNTTIQLTFHLQS